MSDSSKLQTPALAQRHRIGQVFEWLCCGSTWFGLVVLGILLLTVTWKALTWPAPEADSVRGPEVTSSRPLSVQFLTSYDSRIPQRAGIKAALWGSLWLLVFVTLATTQGWAYHLYVARPQARIA